MALVDPTTGTPEPGNGLVNAEPLMSIRKLAKYYPVKEGVFQRVTGYVKAVDRVSFEINRGETVGLVGESGCGKTSLARCISGLTSPTEGGVYFRLSSEDRMKLDALLDIPESNRSKADQAELKGIQDQHRIDRLSGQSWEEYRRNCQVVFQDAFSSLNPRHLVKDIIARPLKVHGKKEEEIEGIVLDLLERVGLSPSHLYRYPHEFSGGQRQRISIARALALNPALIILDEPTSALDVSVQAQILNLLHELQSEFDLAYLFITHDLSVVRHMSDRMVIMYAGKVVEYGDSSDIFSEPLHPYTESLLAAAPDLGEGAGNLQGLEGTVPDPSRPPQGCRFHPRCPVATERCGWEIQDIVDLIQDDPNETEEIMVESTTPFEGTIRFADSDGSRRLLENVNREKHPLSRAIEKAEVDGSGIRFVLYPVTTMELIEARSSHWTSCILHANPHEAKRSIREQ